MAIPEDAWRGWCENCSRRADFERWTYDGGEDPYRLREVYTGKLCEVCAKQMKDMENTRLEASKHGDLQE